MAASQVQVLRDFGPQGGGWLQCADAQGEFFFNKNTQQSSDTVPPQLAALLGPGGGGMSHQQQPMQSAPQAPAAQPQVLRELGGGWLQCKDQQGIFYHNTQTKQSQNDPPPGIGAAAGPQVQCQAAPSQPQPAASQPQVLRELPGGWLQCRDAQGIYYHNAMTKQSVDQPPPEIAHLVSQGANIQKVQLPPQQQQQQQPAPQAAQAAPQVLREFPGNWLQCKDPQGIFYHNSVTKQTLDNPPPEIAPYVGGGAPAAAQPQPGMAAQAPAGQTSCKGQIGHWQILEDAQGEFYRNAATNQTFDQPPQELLQLLQQQQAQQSYGGKGGKAW